MVREWKVRSLLFEKGRRRQKKNGRRIKSREDFEELAERDADKNAKGQGEGVM